MADLTELRKKAKGFTKKYFETLVYRNYTYWSSYDKSLPIEEIFLQAVLEESKDPRKEYLSFDDFVETIHIDLLGNRISFKSIFPYLEDFKIWLDWKMRKGTKDYCVGRILNDLGIMEYETWNYREYKNLPVYLEIKNGKYKGSIARRVRETKTGFRVLEFDSPKKTIRLKLQGRSLSFRRILSNNVQTLFVEKKEEKKVFNHVDMLGREIKTGDMVYCEHQHSINKYNKLKLKVFGTVKEVNINRKKIKIQLNWTPNKIGRGYIGIEKSIPANLILIINDQDIKDTLMILKLKS